MASNFSLNVKINGTEQAVSSIGEIESALRATKQELKDVEVNSTAFDELSKQARTLQDELKGSFREATNFDKNLGQLGESVGRLGSSVTSSFGLITSAYQLFGSESKEVTEAQVKAQQLLAASLFATNIAINAQKIAGDAKLVVDRLSLGITKLLTIAFGEQKIALAAQAVATGNATVAQRLLNIAMNANPALLLLTVITSLAGAFLLYSDSTEESTVNTESYTESLKRNNEVVDRNIEKLKEQYRVQIQIAKLRGEDVTAFQLETKLIEEELSIRKGQFNKSIKDIQDYVITQTDLVKSTSGVYSTVQKEFLSNTDELIKTLDRLLTSDPGNTALKTVLDNYRNLTREVTKLENDLTIKNEEELKKRRDDYKKTYDKIVDDTKKSLQELNKLEVDYNEQLTKLRLDQEKNSEAIVRNELRLEEEKVNKIFEIRKREIDEFFGPNSKKSIELTNQLTKERDETIASLTGLFDFRIELAKKEDDLIIKQKEEQAAKILQIQSILQKEISFGDQNTLDDLETIQARRSELEANRLLFELENNKTSLEDFKKTQEEILEETEKALKIRQTIEENELRVRQTRDLKNLEDNLKKEFDTTIDFEVNKLDSLNDLEGEELKKEEERLKKEFSLKEGVTKKEKDLFDILVQSKLNSEKEYQINLEEIRQDYEQKNQNAAKKSEDEILAYRLQKLQEFQNTANDVLSAIGLGVDLFQALSDLAKTNRENDLIDLRNNNDEKLNAINEQYNAELQAQQTALQQGLIDKEQYNAAILELDTNRGNSQKGLEDKLRKAELAAKKKGFEDEKKLRIATTIISGAQGALQAFVSAQILPFPASVIVGSSLAALAATTTAIQVAAISKQRFDDSGSQNITTPNPSGAGSLGGGSSLPPQQSTGGFTQFNPSLTGAPTGGSQNEGNRKMATRVYVLESDITATQNRVSVAETGATIG